MFDRVKILQVAGNGIRAIVRETGFNWRTWRCGFAVYCVALISRNSTNGLMMRIAPGYTAFAALPALCVKTSRQFAMRSPKHRAMARPKVRLTNSRHSDDPCMAAPVPLCCALE